jgi:hypothetical protein
VPRHPERSEGPAFDFDFCFSIVILSGAKDLLSILTLILPLILLLTFHVILSGAKDLLLILTLDLLLISMSS